METSPNSRALFDANGAFHVRELKIFITKVLFLDGITPGAFPK